MNNYPDQPVYEDALGVLRFERNPIIDMLVEKVGLNQISIWWQQNNIDIKYTQQLAQLIGYSVSGYTSLSYVSEESKDEYWDKYFRYTES